MIERINYLVKFLNECTVAYDNGTPVIADAEWDKLYFELVDLEQKTNIILSNSPTQSIHYCSSDNIDNRDLLHNGDKDLLFLPIRPNLHQNTQPRIPVRW